MVHPLHYRDPLLLGVKRNRRGREERRGEEGREEGKGEEGREEGKGEEGREKRNGGRTGPIFSLIKVEENRRYRLHHIPEHVSAITHTNRISIFGRYTLKPGRYTVIPSTFEPGYQRAFYIRMYTEHANRAK